MFLFRRTTKAKKESFVVNETLKTPEFVINYAEGLIRIRGKSIPEDSDRFYKPILEKLDWYVENAPDKTRVTVHFDYFNTTSSKYILKIFRRFEDIYRKYKDITIYWYYEADDLDMMYCGEDYQSILSVPFKLVEIEEQ